MENKSLTEVKLLAYFKPYEFLDNKNMLLLNFSKTIITCKLKDRYLKVWLGQVRLGQLGWVNLGKIGMI